MTTEGKVIFYQRNALSDIESTIVVIADGYMARNLQRWTKNYEMAKTEEIPEMQKLQEFLQKNLPVDGEDVTLVHGDFRYIFILLALRITLIRVRIEDAFVHIHVLFLILWRYRSPF